MSDDLKRPDATGSDEFAEWFDREFIPREASDVDLDDRETTTDDTPPADRPDAAPPEPTTVEATEPDHDPDGRQRGQQHAAAREMDPAQRRVQEADRARAAQGIRGDGLLRLEQRAASAPCVH